MSTLKGLDKLLWQLEELDLFKKGNEAEEVILNSILEVPLHHVPLTTGALRNSFFVNPIGGGVVYGFGAEHGVYTNFGTGLYYNYSQAVVDYSMGVTKMTGRQTGWRYYNAVYDRYFYTRGQQPQHWFEAYVEEVEKRIVIDLEKRLEGIFNGV